MPSLAVKGGGRCSSACVARPKPERCKTPDRCKINDENVVNLLRDVTHQTTLHPPRVVALFPSRSCPVHVEAPARCVVPALGVGWMAQAVQNPRGKGFQAGECRLQQDAARSASFPALPPTKRQISWKNSVSGGPVHAGLRILLSRC